MKKLIALAFMILASAASAADAGRYVASKNDKTFAGMVERWAAQDGRGVKWEAADVEILDAESVNHDAHLRSASTFDEAVQRALKSLAEASQNRNDLPPLQACKYSEGKVYMVIHDLRESCGNPEAARTVGDEARFSDGRSVPASALAEASRNVAHWGPAVVGTSCRPFGAYSRDGVGPKAAFLACDRGTWVKP